MLSSFTSPRFSFLALAAGFAITANGAVVPPDTLVAGKTASEWMATCFKWLMEIPAGPTHPLYDETGAHALRNQSGPVWFLGGVFNDSAVAVRNISVPDDIWLFVNMVGVECSTLEPPPFYGSNEEELRSCAENVRFSDLFFSIDGEPVPDLERFYVSTPIFDFTMPENNIFSVPGGGSGQAVGAGPAVIVAPLSPGVHDLHFRVNLPDFFNGPSRITYRITAYARPAITIRPVSDLKEAELSWPSNPGFVLQETVGSAELAWKTASTISPPRVDEAGITRVNVMLGSENRFFRLRKL